MDNLPCATKFMTGTQVHVDQGYRLGFINGNEVSGADLMRLPGLMWLPWLDAVTLA